MKTANLVVLMASLLALAGCATTEEPVTSEFPVRVGMPGSYLRERFGEPLRIEQRAGGGEDWYYQFYGWKVSPVSESGTRVEYGEKSSYVSVGVSSTKLNGEQPIHLSPEGKVIGPIPEGKVVRR
jgi:hypothetical protein